jgi:alpha/beta superfamily hydrolase
LTDCVTAAQPGVTTGGLSLPHYFGPERTFFGLLNWPKGPVRAGALICPPLGYEAVTAHQSLRVLAEQLAQAGVATLRIDYAGTGNSLGSPRDPDRVAAWENSIEPGLDELRSLGIDTVTLVGVRFGAGLAAKVAARSFGHNLLVMWDPIPSGRRYSRAMKLMASTATSADPANSLGTVSVAGIEFTEQTLQAISKTNISADDLVQPTLVVVRPRSSTDDPTPDFGAADVCELPGTAEMIDASAEEAKVAHRIVDHIVAWILRRDLGQGLPAGPAPTLAVETSQPHADLLLTHRLIRFGPTELFGVLTTAAGTSPSSAVLMLNNGAAPNIGPGRAWIDWAAQQAVDGFMTLRLDMSGLGESKARDPREEQVVYSRAVNDDVREAVSYLRESGVSRIAVLGLCSGATHGFRALGAGVDIDAIVSINPGLHSPVCYYRTDLRHSYHRVLPRLFAVPLHKTPLFELLDRIPTWVWRILDKTRLVRTPTLLPKVAVNAQVPALLIFGQDEWGLRALRKRDPGETRNLLAAPTLTMEVFDSLDHSMFDLEARRQVEEIVEKWLHKELRS